MDEFDRRKATPQYWYNKASDLRASAGAVWYCNKHDLSQDISKELGISWGLSSLVFPMLCGLALELMYKAICVKKHKEFCNTHNLENLANIAGVDIPKDMLPRLKLFTESIIWDAKYPVPTDKQRQVFDGMGDLRRKATLTLVKTSGSLKIYRTNGEQAWATFEAFWESARKVYLAS